MTSTTATIDPTGRPSTGDRSVTSHLVRAMVLAASGTGAALLVEKLYPTEDANIGAGLALMAVVLAVTGGWAFVDGLRRGPGGGSIRQWAIVAVLAGALTALAMTAAWVVTSDDLGVTDLPGMALGSFVAMVPSLPFLIAPAVLAAWLGERLSRNRTR